MCANTRSSDRIYFKYQNLSFLAEYLIRATQAKTEQLVNSVDDGLIDLRNAIIRKEIPESENPNKIVDILMSNKKVKELKYYLLNKCFKDYQ